MPQSEGERPVAPPVDTGASEMKRAVDVAARAAKGLASDVKSEAAALGGEAKSQLGEGANTQLHGLAESLSGLSTGLANTAGLDETWAKPLVGHAAEALQSVAGYIRDSNPESLMRDAHTAARERPIAVMLGAVAVGFALARAGKVMVAQLPHGAPNDASNL